MRTQTQMRSLLVAFAALFAALAIGACGDDDGGGDSGGDESASGGTIAFLLPETQTARYESLDKPLFEAKVEELCPDCEINYQNADQDPAKQQQQVEAAVTEGVDVMVLDPVDSTTAGSLAAERKAADIPVISYDRLILDTDLDYYVAFDSLEVGRQQGESLTEKLAEDGNDTGPIVKINGDPKDNNATLFRQGSTEVFEDGGRRDRGGGRHARLAARERPAPDGAGDHLDRRGRDQGRLCAERRHCRRRDRRDEGRRHEPEGDPGDRPGRRADRRFSAIIAGEQYMTVYKPIQPLAENAAELAVAVANGEEPSSDLVTSETDNGTEQVPTVVIETIPVTAENVNDTIVADDVYPVDEICTGQYAKACEEAGIS